MWYRVASDPRESKGMTLKREPRTYFPISRQGQHAHPGFHTPTPVPYCLVGSGPIETLQKSPIQKWVSGVMTGPHCGIQAALELVIPLPQLPECWKASLTMTPYGASD